MGTDGPNWGWKFAGLGFYTPTQQIPTRPGSILIPNQDNPQHLSLMVIVVMAKTYWTCGPNVLLGTATVIVTNNATIGVGYWG